MLELVGKVKKAVVIANIIKDNKALVIISGEEHLVLPRETYSCRIPDIDNKFGIIHNYLKESIESFTKELNSIRYVIIYTNSNKNLDTFRNFLLYLEEKCTDKIYILAHKG